MLKIISVYKTKLGCLDNMIKSFRLTEKTLFSIFAIILIISSLSLLWKVNLSFISDVPAHGGSLNEGLVGSPRFINPLLEMSDVDRDLTYLVYSGLMRATAKGDLIPDLAENYTISPDGLVYTFKIKDNAYFQDGYKVTADDIEYTIKMAQDISLRSPKRNSWTGVKTEKISSSEIAFRLDQPYSPFLENTTLGILPKHIWSNATTDEFTFSTYNSVNPIGSGPYMISDIKKNDLGIPVYYELKAFDQYALEEPYITTIRLDFFANEKDLADAYQASKIESTSALSLNSLSSLNTQDGVAKKKISLPRIFGVFFNQNQAKIFLNKEVRAALDMTVDKDRIVTEALGGYGKKINSPLPDGILLTTNAEEVIYNKEESVNQAKELLIKGGWKYNETDMVWEKKSKTETQKLAFSISTSNTPDLKRVADILKEDWTLLGAQVEVLTFDPSDLNQSIIGQRKYDTLLFGQVIGRNLDLFAYWHSSQRNTGSNMAMYTNSKADKLLEEARQISDKDKRLEKYALFEKEIKNDIPAIFLYTPEFIYILPPKIKGFVAGFINNRSERYEDIYKWYIETDKIWNFLI